MTPTRQLDELARRFLDGLPAGLGAVHDDVRQNVKAAANAALERMDLVTREEFEIQRLVLERTREKLEQLEARVAELEAARKA